MLSDGCMVAVGSCLLYVQMSATATTMTLLLLLHAGMPPKTARQLLTQVPSSMVVIVNMILMVNTVEVVHGDTID